MSTFLSHVLQDPLGDEGEEILRRILGYGLVPAEESGRHRVAACGRFGGHLTADVLALAGNPKFVGALVVAEEDAERVLYLENGVVVGSASNVLFERLGRLLYQAKVVTHDDSEMLIELEEEQGDATLLDWLPEDVMEWVLRRRVDAVAAALPYIRHGHFALVDGDIDLQGLPGLSVDSGAVAGEACRLYEAWRHGTAGAEEEASDPSEIPAPLPGPLHPLRTRAEEVDDIFRRIREADLGFK